PNPAFTGMDSFTYQIADNGGLFSNQATVLIPVLGSAANNSPVLAPIGNKSVDEGTLLSFTATAPDPDAGQTLILSLIGAPGGASINPTTGVFTWTPTEVQGPGSYTFTVRVTDDGSPSLFAEELITVAVDEVNQAPVLAPIGSKSVDEQTPLTFTI